jgi:hypothetical protein
MWEYQVELEPSETKNIWLIDNTFSTAFANGVNVISSSVYPPEPPPNPNTYDQTWLTISLSDQNTWSYTILDWTSQRIYDTVDLGFSPPNYNNLLIYPLINQGYLLDSYTEISGDTLINVYLNSVGTIIQTYSAVTTDFISNILDNVWSVLADNTNGIFMYFNGSYYGSFNYDFTYQEINILDEYNAVLSTGSFCIESINTTANTTTIKVISSEGEIQDIKTYDNINTFIDVIQYFDGNFIGLLERSGNLSSLQIYDSTGTILLQDISLTGDTYDSYNISCYGNNKMTFCCWNNEDDTIDYLIYNYNGNTDTLLTTTQDRSNHPSYSSYFIENLSPSNSPSENMFINFHKDGPIQDNQLYAVQYSTILSFINESPTINSYVFQNSGTNSKFMGLSNVNISNTLFIPVDTGNGILSVLSLNSSGNTITPTIAPSSGFTYITSEAFGDNSFLAPYDENNNYDTYVIVNGSDGNIRDSLFLPDASFGHVCNYDTLRFYDNTSSSVWYVNNQNSGFTQTEFLTDSYTESGWYTPNFRPNGTIVLSNGITGSTKIITPSTSSEIFSIPTFNGPYNITVGTDYVLYVGLDSSSAFTVSNLYNFNGNLVNTYRAPIFGSTINSSSVDSRYFFNFKESSTRDSFYMFSPRKCLSVSLRARDNQDNAPNTI